MLENKPIRFRVIFFISLMILLSLNQVFALGITPGRTSVDFVEDKKFNVPFSVLNNDHKNMQVVFFVQGELNDSIKLSDNSEEFLASEESKSFFYDVKLSKKLEPGLHTAEIVALELPQVSSDGTYVGATVAVVSQLYVYAPYPGKYVDVEFNVFDTEQNGTATFVIPVINRGS